MQTLFLILLDEFLHMSPNGTNTFSPLPCRLQESYTLFLSLSNNFSEFWFREKSEKGLSAYQWSTSLCQTPILMLQAPSWITVSLSTLFSYFMFGQTCYHYSISPISHWTNRFKQSVYWLTIIWIQHTNQTRGESSTIAIIRCGIDKGSYWRQEWHGWLRLHHKWMVENFTTWLLITEMRSIWTIIARNYIIIIA